MNGAALWDEILPRALDAVGREQAAARKGRRSLVVVRGTKEERSRRFIMSVFSGIGARLALHKLHRGPSPASGPKTSSREELDKARTEAS